MWIVYAFGSALFAGLTAILAKIGIRNTDSNLATAIRTVVILVFSWAIVVAIGSQKTMPDLTAKTIIFLCLSGFATGASWLCYFKALQIGDVNKVVPVDKSSIILTVLIAFFFFDEQITFLKVSSLALIGLGTFMMIDKKKSDVKQTKSSWLIYAVLSAVFAALTSILGKIGIEGVESNLGTAIRTVVVLIMAWGIVFMQKTQYQLKQVDAKSWIFLIASGITTGLSWLCYYRALQDGLVSVVVPIDKLSIVVAIAFSYLVFDERLTKKNAVGLGFIIVGTMGMIL